MVCSWFVTYAKHSIDFAPKAWLSYISARCVYPELWIYVWDVVCFRRVDGSNYEILDSPIMVILLKFVNVLCGCCLSGEWKIVHVMLCTPNMVIRGVWDLACIFGIEALRLGILSHLFVACVQFFVATQITKYIYSPWLRDYHRRACSILYHEMIHFVAKQNQIFRCPAPCAQHNWESPQQAHRGSLVHIVIS